jgi:hypothetical protein
VAKIGHPVDKSSYSPFPFDRCCVRFHFAPFAYALSYGDNLTAVAPDQLPRLPQMRQDPPGSPCSDIGEKKARVTTRAPWSAEAIA